MVQVEGYSNVKLPSGVVCRVEPWGAATGVRQGAGPRGGEEVTVGAPAMIVAMRLTSGVGITTFCGGVGTRVFTGLPDPGVPVGGVGVVGGGPTA